VPARQVNAAVPAALGLAGDLEHWLADEPVAAYREPAGARLRRWVRKHPRRVTAAGVLLLAAVVGLTAGAILLERSKRLTREAHATFETALGKIEGSVNAVNEEYLLDEPELQGVKHKVLSHAHDDYAELLKKYPGDQRVKRQYAEVKRRLGELYLLGGRSHREDEGIPRVKEALRLYEELLRQAPEDQQVRFGLAHAHHALAELLLQKGVLGDGEKEVDCAIELLEPLTAENRENESFRALLARSYDLRATARWSRGDVGSGLADNRKALEIVESLLSAPTLGVPSRRNIAGLTPWPLYETDRFEHIKGSLVLLPRAYTNRGLMLNSAGRNAEAARVLQMATAFDRWLAEPGPGPELGPRPRQFRHALALALLHTGHVQVELGRPARAELALREAREQMQRLCQDDPKNPEYAATHLLTAGCLGEALLRSGRTSAADGFLREACEQGEDVLGGPGKTPLLHAQHARLFHVLGCLRRESGDVAQGLELAQRAREKLERALAAAPGDPSLRSAWLGSREELALCRYLWGDTARDTCITEQRSVLAERRDLASSTRAPGFQGEFAASAALLARLLLEGSRPAEALACVEEVLHDHEPFVREEQERARVRRAEASKPPAKPDPSRPEPAWPVYLFRMPVEPDDLQLRRQWALLLARQSEALVGVGRSPEAVDAACEAIAMTEGLHRGDDEWRCPLTPPLSVWSFFAEELCRQEPCYLYDLACQLALASTLPGNAGLADPAGRAVQALRNYIASGFDNARKLRTDPALAPLRQRADFEQVVGDLEARVRGT
jgi:tetratricopeptide (TPR) repeat protein